MSQVVLRGGGFLPTTTNNSSSGDTVKTQTEPEKQDILVMDTKLKIIEILQVKDMQYYTYVDVQAVDSEHIQCIQYNRHSLTQLVRPSILQNIHIKLLLFSVLPCSSF